MESREPLTLTALRGRINQALEAFIEADNHYLTEIGPELVPVASLKIALMGIGSDDSKGNEEYSRRGAHVHDQQ